MNSHPEKCSCENVEHSQEFDSSNDSPSSKDSKKSKSSLTVLGFNLRRGRPLQVKNKRPKKCSTTYCCDGGNNNGDRVPTSNFNNVSNKKSPKWPLKLYYGKKEQKVIERKNQSCCNCACYKRSEEHHLDAGVVFPDEGSCYKENTIEPAAESSASENNLPDNITLPESQADTTSQELLENTNGRLAHVFVTPNFIDLHWRTLGQDVDEEARIQRAREIECGVDPPPSFRPSRKVQLLCSDENEGHVLRRLQIVCPNDISMDSLKAIFQNNVTFRTCPLDIFTGCHTQVDFIHCLVPDLLSITNCSFYWGKMDRYEAERLLDGKREGTFLLRDSAQEEFLFSVSFRKYGRSLHARIEQWNHKFSFDSHDPGVYTSETVCGLIEHYKDPSSCMFFEPMLTWPLHRNFVFSLQHLCRASIVNRLTYDDVNQLQLPKSLKIYLKEYHYRQKVRVERFDDDVEWIELRNTPT